MKIRIYPLAVAICLMAVLLAGCKNAEQHLQEVNEEIGAPPDTTLLASQVQAGQGSQDACYFTSLFELYGSKWSIEKVIEYYADELANNDWLEPTPEPWISEERKDATLLFQRDNAFRVVIYEPLPDEIGYLFDDVPVASEPYATIYLVTLIYADAIAQRDCPIWQSESNE